MKAVLIVPALNEARWSASSFAAYLTTPSPW